MNRNVLQTTETYIPPSPEIVKQETVNAIEHGADEVLKLREKGQLPKEIINIGGLYIDKSMPLGERLQIVSNNSDIFAEAVKTALSGVDPKVFKKRVMQQEVPETHIFDWIIDGHRSRAVYYRLGKQMALMENYYIDDTNNPIGIRPQLWLGNDLINFVLRKNAPHLLPRTPSQPVAFRPTV